MGDPASARGPVPLSLPAVAAWLDERLRHELPGLDAQRLMAPVPRPGWQPAEWPRGSRRAAALLLLFPADGHTYLALTLRSSHLPHHGGQVCLPGGAVEDEETIEDAALRETAEEVGVSRVGLRVIGPLTPLHIPVSGFVLHPVIAWTDTTPTFHPAAHEVERLITVRLEQLCDPHAVRLRFRRHEGREYEVPYFLLDGEVVWGATAMILAEFLAVLGHPPFRPTQAEH